MREIHVDLPAANGTLEIVSNPRGAVIAIDDRALDDTAPVLLAPYPAGAYTVSASIDGWHTQERAVEVLPNARSEVAFELERLPVGEVFLDLTPRDAKVAIAGSDESYHRGIRLRRGTYEFRVERDGYASESFRLPVVPGRNQRTVRLARLKARLTVASTPSDAIVHVSYRAGQSWRDVRYAGPLTLPAGEVTHRGPRGRLSQLRSTADPCRQAACAHHPHAGIRRRAGTPLSTTYWHRGAMGRNWSSYRPALSEWDRPRAPATSARSTMLPSRSRSPSASTR